MNLACFLGGALTGAGILTGLALRSAQSESRRDPAFTPEEAARMDASTASLHLSIYFFKINALAMKCTSVSLHSGPLCLGPLEIDGESVLQKAKSRMDGFMTRTGRAFAVSMLKDQARDMQSLFQRYRPVFVRANRLLAAKRQAGVRLGGFVLHAGSFAIDNSLANDRWLEDFDSLCDRLRDFAQATGRAGDRLISLLEAHCQDGTSGGRERGAQASQDSGAAGA